MKVASRLCKSTLLKYLKWLICEPFILFVCKSTSHWQVGSLQRQVTFLFIFLSLVDMSHHIQMIVEIATETEVMLASPGMVNTSLIEMIPD